MVKKYGSLIVVGLIVALVFGTFAYQSCEIGKLRAMRDQDKIDNINRQDSLHTATQMAIINLAKKQQDVYAKKDSIDNSKIKRRNEIINHLHISYDSLPNF